MQGSSKQSSDLLVQDGPLLGSEDRADWFYAQIYCYSTHDRFISYDVISFIMELPEYSNAQQYFISPEGMSQLLHAQSSTQYPGENILWTTDSKTELPIRMS